MKKQSAPNVSNVISMLTFFAQNEEATLQIAQNFSKACLSTTKQAIIFLKGPLGAGKTTFTRGFLQALGHQGKVKSPTYTLVESYHFSDEAENEKVSVQNCKVYHFDFYRLSDPEELEFIGIREYLSDKAICLIEWPEKGQGVLPAPDILMQIEGEEDERTFKMAAKSALGEKILSCIKIKNEAEKI